MRKKIDEILVVEGRDDSANIKRALEAETIETHGYGISRETWQKLERAYETKGLIVFTDPDHAGEEIRRRVLEKFPNSKEAFLSKNQAEKNGNIGIENAEAEDIVRALKKAKAKLREQDEKPYIFTMADMEKAGLEGQIGAKERRREVGAKLGIGYGNSKAFLRKLNSYGITKEEFDNAQGGK